MPTAPIVNVRDVEERTHSPTPYASAYKILTPTMRDRGGTLGVNQVRLPKGSATCPFHWHTREDEVFYVLSGRGVLRYGEDMFDVGPGDCISCPAGTKIAHQIGNPFDEDLVYLAIGPYDPHEVCGYPDSGKLLVRAAGQVGVMEETEYMHGEPLDLRIFDLAKAR